MFECVCSGVINWINLYSKQTYLELWNVLCAKYSMLMCAYKCLYMYIHICICMYMCKGVQICVYMYIHEWICIHMFVIHVHTCV